MPFQPLYDRVLVRVNEQEKTSAGGIFLPQSGAKRKDEGEVVAAGPGHFVVDGRIVPLSLKVGDRVRFIPGAGLDIDVDGEEFTLFQEAEILGVIS
jgi:chaperonin GroES